LYAQHGHILPLANGPTSALPGQHAMAPDQQRDNHQLTSICHLPSQLLLEEANMLFLLNIQPVLSLLLILAELSLSLSAIV